MIVYRLGGREHAHKLDGAGAARSGGRWNPPGTALLYTSAHRSLSLCEVLVHFPDMAVFPSDYEWITYRISGSYRTWRPPLSALPTGWSDPRAFSREAQLLGDRFQASDALLMRVPSVVVHQEYNYLINPRHVAKHVRIIRREPFGLDERLNILLSYT